MKKYLNNLEKSVLSMMIDNLDDMEGREGYISELAFDLFESENATGSITCNAWAAEEWIGEHFHDLGDVVDEMAAEWDITPNPFASPETFQVQVVLFVASGLVPASDWTDYRDDDAITYDTETIEIIKREWQEALDA
jgi:hypothetical protein